MPVSEKIEGVTRKVLADILGLSEERVRQLVHDGLPQIVRSNRTLYVPRDVIRWLRARDVEKATRDAKDGEANEAEERALKVRAERELKELELAERRRELIPAEEYRTQVDSLVGGFAAVALGRLQQFERRIVQATTAADARRLTQVMTGALMQGAQDYGETLEQDAEAA